MVQWSTIKSGNTLNAEHKFYEAGKCIMSRIRHVVQLKLRSPPAVNIVQKLAVQTQLRFDTLNCPLEYYTANVSVTTRRVNPSLISEFL